VADPFTVRAVASVAFSTTSADNPRAMKISESNCQAMPDRRTRIGRRSGYWFAYPPR